MALAGLYFMAQVDNSEFFTGDILILVSSVLFAFHVVFTGRLAIGHPHSS